MSTLLLRLAGPMQSWGTQSRFRYRDTGLEPSKSAVVGLICAALGRPRHEPVDDLAALRMGVRVDQEGSTAVDYHTAGGTHHRGDNYGVYKADGSRPGPLPSHRYYLADADFLVGLEGDEALLLQIEQAVARPHWALFLGRKSFVPGVPVSVPDGLRLGLDLKSALVSYPWPRPGAPVPAADRRPASLRLVLQADHTTGEDVRRDQPLGAAFLDRRFGLRYVRTEFLRLGEQVPIREV